MELEFTLSLYEQTRIEELNFIDTSLEEANGVTEEQADAEELLNSVLKFKECNILEKILIDATLKKNVEVIKLTYERINEKLMNMMDYADELCQNNTWVNEKIYLGVCNYCKSKHAKVEALYQVIKRHNVI